MQLPIFKLIGGERKVSGLGGLVVFAVFAAASLAAAGYLARTLALEGKLFSEHAELLKAEAQRQIGSIKIESIQVQDDNRTVVAGLLNDESPPVAASRLSQMDLILVYDEVGGGVRVVWLPYDKTGLEEEGWRALNITYGNGSEILNPVSSDFSTGLWDSGEKLYIQAWVSQGHPIQDGRAVLIAATPEGVKTR